MDNLTLISCSYNTPQVTLTMLRSFAFHHSTITNLLLMENSSDDTTAKLLDAENVPYIRHANYSHAEGVNNAFKQCKTKYALLVDSDIIFLKNCEDIYKMFTDSGYAAAGKITGDRGGKKIYNRIDPWFCFIDMEQIQKYNIPFCDIERTKKSFKEERIYDIGSTFFKDMRKKDLKIGNLEVDNRYFMHMEGMSWYKNKYDPTKPDTGIDFGGTHNNKGLYEMHMLKEAHFNSIKKPFDLIKLTGVFV